jgi:hypothetical protein
MMSSFLSKKRTKERFFEKISSEPEATKNNRIFSLKNFELFIKSKYLSSYSKMESNLNQLRGS